MILTIDFETYYSKEYSLTKLTTEEYIRDPRFEVIGVAVKVGDADTEWFSGSKEAIRKWLRQFPWEKSSALAHNMMFDGAILSWHFDIRPKFLLDTLSMGQALVGSTESVSLRNLLDVYAIPLKKGSYVLQTLGKQRLDFLVPDLENYKHYCINDVDACRKLYDHLKVGFPKIELFVIDRTLRMFTEPQIVLDSELLKEHSIEVKEHRKMLLQRLQKGMPVFLESIRSDNQFAELLRNEGVEPPTKISKTTGKQAYAFAKTDEEFKELLEHPSEKVRFLVEARLGLRTSIEETRVKRFLDISQRGPLPVPLRYYAAHTGRWGGSDKINLQNLPSRGASNKLKASLTAPPGFVFGECDSSQIEARVLAWIAGEDKLLEGFRKGVDVYKEVASTIFHKPVANITPNERFIAKTAVLGAGYGMGPGKFHLMMQQQNKTMDIMEANAIISGYRKSVPSIVRFWEKMQVLVVQMYDLFNAKAHAKSGWVKQGVLNLTPVGLELPSGMLMRYPNLRQDPNTSEGYTYENKRGLQKLYGGKLTENIVQALARCIISEQLIIISTRYRVVLTVHDSIVTLLPKAESEEGLAFMKATMRTPPAWAKDLPLNCEGEYSERY